MRRLSIGLILVGLLLMAVNFLYTIIKSPMTPMIKYSLVAIIIGLSILLISLVKERLKDREEESDDLSKY